MNVYIVKLWWNFSPPLNTCKINYVVIQANDVDMHDDLVIFYLLMLHVTCDLFMKKYTYADMKFNFKVNMHTPVAYLHKYAACLACISCMLILKYIYKAC